MITLGEKDVVKNFDDAMCHLGRQGAMEYRALLDSCLKIPVKLVNRMHVREGTVATAEWRLHHQKELRQEIEAALHYLNKIEAGDFDKRTS